MYLPNICLAFSGHVYHFWVCLCYLRCVVLLFRCLYLCDNVGFYFLGCVAGDEDTYSTFADFLDPVIDKRHNGYPKTAKHVTDLTASKLTNANFDTNFVLSSRVRTGRSIRPIPLPPHCNRAERRKVEEILCKALDTLSGDLSGT